MSFKIQKLKKGLWQEIKNIFSRKGYAVTEDILDGKFRNMKHHYKTISDNNKNTKTGRGRICWEFFDEMDQLLQIDIVLLDSLITFI